MRSTISPRTRLKLSPRSLATSAEPPSRSSAQGRGGYPHGRHAQRLAEALDQADAARGALATAVLTFAAVAEGLARGYRAGASGCLRLDRPASGGAARISKRIVAHRYQMETVVPLWRRFADVDPEAQRLRERLGHHQDSRRCCG